MTKIDQHPPRPDRLPELPGPVRLAIRAAFGKKGGDVVVLDLRHAGAFTDFFVVCSGQTSRQVKAIADAVEDALKNEAIRPAHVEGYVGAAWVLMDYFDFVVHVFTPDTRAFYALERLWGSAHRYAVSERDVS
jgi:ribosome-associated protein